MVDLKALSPAALEKLCVDAGHAAYRGRQIHDWLHRHGAHTFDAMTNVPASLRSHLERITWIRHLTLSKLQVARDGTRKALFLLDSGRQVESVLIPDFSDDGSVRRLTVCVSSQVGCAMGCTFCATGRMGFHQDLTASEIFDQVVHMNRIGLEAFTRHVTNVVYMGMGEPLLNYGSVLSSIKLLTDERLLSLSPRRLTVSTVGLAGRIRQLADDKPGCQLAVSLHAPDDAKRSSIMPVNRKAKTDLTALREALRYYHQQTGQTVTYEYCMFAGFNDSPQDARRLAAIGSWVPSKVNLIMYNQVANTGFQQTDEQTLNEFIRTLVSRNVRVTVRRSRGQDIAAACGQLAGQASG